MSRTMDKITINFLPVASTANPFQPGEIACMRRGMVCVCACMHVSCSRAGHNKKQRKSLKD
jgi:hypothetical protein